MRKSVNLLFYLVVLGMFTVYAHAQSVFINEIHYDNASTDVNEGVEIAGPAGTNLDGWQILGYNGSNGEVYKTENITSTTIPDQQDGYGTVWFAISSLQNGAPDGIALVDNGGTVIQFLSYEGSFDATDGPANGMTSEDIGVSESSGTSGEESLQLSGTGATYTDFTWNAPAANTRGSINTGQTFSVITTTTVQFASSGATVNEGDGSYNLVVTITNPDGGAATTADVVLISGDAADIGNYTTQMVTFPAGSSDNQTVVITITDDSDIEGNETLTFELQNVSGGNNAAAGSPSQFDLLIEDNDFGEAPAIVINEIMQNPSAVNDSKGEWFEIYNADDSAVDINGWVIADNGTDSHTIDNGGPLTINPGAYLVLGINDTTSVNGGLTVDYVYSGYFLANGDDEVILFLSDGVTEVDRVEYDGGTNWPDPTGKSMELTNPGLDNNDGANWAEAVTTFGDGDYGTPGALNSTYVSSIGENDPAVITSYKLHNNFPNPFNPGTTLRFDAPRNSGSLELVIYDVLGKKIKTLYSGGGGQITREWNGKNESGNSMPSGIYFAILKTKNFSQSIKMLLVK
jgi:hypothetical protein